MDVHVRNLALNTLGEYKKLVWPEVRKYLRSPSFPSSFKIQKKYKPLERYHWKLASDYPLRKGKYLRPTLLMLASGAMGKKEKVALRTAVAMQLSEEWILISDDLEDGSLMRRGKPTLHRVFGPELAVNASDTLQTIMWRTLLDNWPILGAEKSRKIFEEFYSIIMRTELGQTVEIKWFKGNKLNFTDDDWYFIADSKSSYYSITGPIRLGAIIAGASSNQLELIDKFGIELGRCWQLVDDILDITTDFKGLKQKGNDIYEGKRTIMLGHLLRSTTVGDKERIISILNKPREKKLRKDVSWIIKKMHDYGSVAYAQSLAKKHKEKSEKLFEKNLSFLYHEPQRAKVESLINFILERDY